MMPAHRGPDGDVIIKDGKPLILSDGCGLMSLDLARLIPRCSQGMVIDKDDFPMAVVQVRVG